MRRIAFQLSCLLDWLGIAHSSRVVTVFGKSSEGKADDVGNKAVFAEKAGASDFLGILP